MFKRAILLSGVFLLAVCNLTFAQPAPIWKTGQTTCYDTSGNVINCAGTGQDGEKRAGVAWPNPRFTVSGDCVTDNLTGLMWAKNANLPNGVLTWQGALDYVASINSGPGLCGHHDWSLPNRKELRSLIDYSQYDPALPLNHPFINVQSDCYWSSSSSADFTYNAWIVSMWLGGVHSNIKDVYYYVWPVRSGQFQKPSVSTGSATNMTPHSATLQGTVNPNGLSTTYYFEWGTTTAYGNKSPATPASAGDGLDNVAVSTNLTGLTAHTNYHFRLVATNNKGTTYGSDMSFIASVKAMPWLMLLLGD